MTSRGRAILSALMLVASGAMAWVEAATLRGTVAMIARDGESGDPAGAIVWIDGAPGGSNGAWRGSIETRNKTFDPSVVAVPAGSTVSFPNADPILHNVFSLSRGNRFDLGLYGQGEGHEVAFRNPGIVRVYCNVHPQMEAFIVVTPGRWLTRVETDGSFVIADAPVGRYELRVWDRRSGSSARTVELAADETVIVDFQLDASRYRRRPHLDKHGRPYVGRDRY
jgi:plastocyanin